MQSVQSVYCYFYVYDFMDDHLVLTSQLEGSSSKKINFPTFRFHGPLTPTVFLFFFFLKTCFSFSLYCVHRVGVGVRGQTEH